MPLFTSRKLSTLLTTTLAMSSIPGLVMSLGILAITTLAGATVAGILVGALTAGAGAVPAAVAGGELGLDAGFLILDAMGIGFLLREVFGGISEVFDLVKSSMAIAWNAGSNPRIPPMTDIEKAAQGLAGAVAEMVSVLLQGVLIWILKESAVARAGKLGKGSGSLTDPGALATRGNQVLRDLNAKSSEVQAILKQGAAELAAPLRKAGQLTRGLADFVESKFEQILKKVTDDAGKKAEELKGKGAGRADGDAPPPPPLNSPRDPVPPKRTWSYQRVQTGRLEPGAVPITPESANLMKLAAFRSAPQAPPGFPAITDSAARTFASTPEPVSLPPGTKSYRIIDNDDAQAGSYWSTDPPPESEASWRAGYAVKDIWNGDGGYVESTVPADAPLNAWGGPTCPQEAAQDGYMLTGGQNQVWVPRGSLIPDGPPQPTPWNN